jgi:hypothetical protein
MIISPYLCLNKTIVSWFLSVSNAFPPLPKIILGITIIISLVSPNIRRVEIEKGIRYIPNFDDPQGIAALDLNLLEPDDIVNYEIGPFVGHLLSSGLFDHSQNCGPAYIRRKCWQASDRPSHLNSIKQFGIRLDDMCLMVLFPAMRAYGYRFFPSHKIPLHHLVEVNDLSITIIDNFNC